MQWETHCKTKRKKEVPRVQSQKTRKSRSCPLQVSWFDVLPCFGDRDELGKFKTRARAQRDKATQIAASTTGSICLPAFPAWHGHVSQALIWRASLGFTVWAELSQRLLRMVEGGWFENTFARAPACSPRRPYNGRHWVGLESPCRVSMGPNKNLPKH